MDPYLEQHWGDVHSSLIIYARNQLQKVLPNDLRARVEERVVVAGLGRKRSIYPHVRVVETRRKSHRPRATSAVAVAAVPYVIELADEEETQTFIEIRDRRGDSQLVTVLEVPSPSNKQWGDSQEQYLRKQSELIDGGINLVEIDLLRAGDWIVAVPEDALTPRLRKSTCRVVVRHGARRNQADYYPISLTERLPTHQIPLRPTDADVTLNLQALIDQ
jgi:hypothetical protein